MEYRIREATCHDEPFLWEMLYEAVFVPPGDPPVPRTAVDRPELTRYVQGFGRRRGDLGWVAETASGDLVGAAWVRQFSSAVRGYGFVDEDTPELSIAVVPDRRGHGVGAALLERLLEAVPRCSLSVDDRSRAVRLYDRFGFVRVARDDHSLTMLRS